MSTTPFDRPLTISQTSIALRQKKISAVELTRIYLERIERQEPSIHALLTVSGEKALEQAELTDSALAQGDDRPLLGIPLVHKDNFMTEGIRTTAASHILDAYIPPYNATVVQRLQEAGAIMLGKANLDAFAHGSSTENSDYGPTHNPWDIDFVPGGSSGGSAAAVAAGECLIATGSDTGGSIRLPAAFTNTVGLKPTYGRVSRYGVIAMGSSFDSIGCFGRNVVDCATTLEVIAGVDARDSTTVHQPVPNYTAHLEHPLQGKVFGLAQEFYSEGLVPEVRQALDDARKVYEDMGVTFKPVHLPHAKYALAAYYILSSSEISSNLARFDGVRFGFSDQEATTLLEMYEQTRGEGFGAEAKRRILMGTYALSAGYYDAYYKKAQQVRTLVRSDFETVFKQVDGLLAPVCPFLPFKIGEKVEEPLAMYLSDILTVPVNLAGIPSLALPAGFAGNLPIGMQLIGPSWSEDQLFNWGQKYQQHTDWHQRVAGEGF